MNGGLLDLRARQLEWARGEAEWFRGQRDRAVRELFVLREVARLAERVVAGLDEDGRAFTVVGGYDGHAAAVDELRAVLGRVEW